MASSRMLWTSSRAASSLMISSSLSRRGFATVMEGLKDSLSHDQLVKVNANNVTAFEINEFGLPYTVMEGLKYSNTHEWVKVDGNAATIGVTGFGVHYKFANRRRASVDDLGLDKAELPMVGAEVCQGNSIGKVKTEMEDDNGILYSPISGEVVEVNEQLVRSAYHVKWRPYEKWWMKVEMKDASDLEKLMDADNYLKFCIEEKEARCLKEMQITESVMKGLKYSDSHVWVKVRGNEATVGITENGRSNIFRRLYVKLPQVGDEVNQGNCFVEYYHTKRSNRIRFLSPVSGKVAEVNDKCGYWWGPDWMHLSPYEEGWMMKVEIEDASEVEKLMDLDNYTKFCDEEKDAKH